MISFIDICDVIRDNGSQTRIEVEINWVIYQRCLPRGSESRSWSARVRRG